MENWPSFWYLLMMALLNKFILFDNVNILEYFLQFELNNSKKYTKMPKVAVSVFLMLFPYLVSIQPNYKILHPSSKIITLSHSSKKTCANISKYRAKNQLKLHK